MTGLVGVIAWAAIAVVLFIIEGTTVQLVSVWFGIGALAALPIAAFSAPLVAQLLVFLAFSILPLILARPFILKKIKSQKVATNADRVIGMIGVVLEPIDNISQSGRIFVDGLDWMARSQDDSILIEKGERVLVCSIEGAKLIVKPAHIMETI